MVCRTTSTVSHFSCATSRIIISFDFNTESMNDFLLFSGQKSIQGENVPPSKEGVRFL